MANDIDNIIEKLALMRPDIKVRRLTVSHRADDDGIWFFSVGGAREVRLESTTGNLPFMVESNIDERRTKVHAVDEAIKLICTELAAK